MCGKASSQPELIFYVFILCLQVYIVVNDPTFHEVAYGLMVVAIAYMGFKNLGYGH